MQEESSQEGSWLRPIELDRVQLLDADARVRALALLASAVSIVRALQAAELHHRDEETLDVGGAPRAAITSSARSSSRRLTRRSTPRSATAATA